MTNILRAVLAAVLAVAAVLGASAPAWASSSTASEWHCYYIDDPNHEVPCPR